MDEREFMNKDIDRDSGKSFIEPIKWCRYIVNVAYVTASLMILAHVIWFFAARSVLAFPPDIYLRDYIILPAIGFILLTVSVDLCLRSKRISLLVKQYLSLSIFVIFSFYLCLTHDIAKVLLASFILPIFASSIFSNIKLTRWVFWMSSLAIFLVGVKIYAAGRFDSAMFMQIFVALFMILCSYLLSKVLIRHNHDNLATLTSFNNHQRYMQEQLKLDLFTGLYNRKTFDDHLSKWMEECRSSNKCLSLAMIDVDCFKSVNDLYGHATGDRVLLYLSQSLKGIQAENVHAFRMGGDEFAVLFRDFTVEEAYRICEDLRTRLECASPPGIDNITVTLSCGLVSRIPKQTSFDVFIKAADAALYAAKNNNRNQVVIYNDLIP
jgi:diguanylate cyclase (GGDEF)-like protein